MEHIVGASSYSRSNELLNSENNAEALGYNYNVFGRFTSRFPTDKDSKSTIKNVYYTIEADYSFNNPLLKILLIRIICSIMAILVSLLNILRKDINMDTILLPRKMDIY